MSQEALWRRYDAIEARLSAPLSERMLDLAELKPGQRVLDLGAGRGEPSLRAAQRVGPTGRVLGIDLSDGLLQMGRELAAQQGLLNLELRAGDVERLEGVRETFDAVTSRWVLMYLQDPVAALRRARAVLKPGGLLVLALWAEPERVNWYSLARRVLAPHRPLPAVDPAAPGVFRYAMQVPLERDLSAAGFRVAHAEELEVPVMEGTPEDNLAWVRAMGMTRLVQDLPEEVQRAWERDFLAATPRQLGGVTRLVVAR